MWRLADRQLGEFLADGQCEFISAYTQPFAMLVVADLLGVPEEDHQRFREFFGLAGNPGEIGAGEAGRHGAQRARVARRSVRASTSRTGAASRATTCSRTSRSRRTPTARTPEVINVVRTATFLFAAGQETTARLLAAALKHLAEHPELQDELPRRPRPHPELPRRGAAPREPGEGRLPPRSRSRRSIGGVDVAAGTPVMLLNGAANRDPRRFECPAEFRIDRANAQSHIAFGRGNHSCPGAPLARAEGRVSLERILDQMHDIRLSEEHHGPPGRSPLRVRAHVGPARSHRAAPRVHAGRGGQVSAERVGSRSSPAARPASGSASRAVRRRRPPRRDLRPQRRGRGGRRPDATASPSRSTSPIARRSRPRSRRCAPSSVRSRSSSPARASNRSRPCSTSPRSAGIRSST